MVPESFKPAQEARVAATKSQIQGVKLGRQRSVVRPPNKIDGKFSARQKTAAGVYAHFDETEAGSSLMGGTASRPASHWLRDSLDSLNSSRTDERATYAGISVDKFMGYEDRRKYAIAQRAQSQRHDEDQEISASHSEPGSQPARRETATLYGDKANLGDDYIGRAV